MVILWNFHHSLSFPDHKQTRCNLTWWHASQRPARRAAICNSWMSTWWSWLEQSPQSNRLTPHYSVYNLLSDTYHNRHIVDKVSFRMGSGVIQQSIQQDRSRILKKCHLHHRFLACNACTCWRILSVKRAVVACVFDNPQDFVRTSSPCLKQTQARQSAECCFLQPLRPAASSQLLLPRMVNFQHLIATSLKLSKVQPKTSKNKLPMIWKVSLCEQMGYLQIGIKTGHTWPYAPQWLASNKIQG